VAEMYLLEVAAIGATAIVATNLDNLLLSISMAQAEGVKRVATAFLSIQILVILLALGISQGLEDLPAHWVGYLGFLPIALGIRELIQKESTDDTLLAGSILQSALVLASNSGDSLAVLVLTFSDGAEQFDLTMVIGSCLAALVLTGALLLLNRLPAVKRVLAPIAKKIQPWLMILIGVLVLWDTPFDVQLPGTATTG
jgi:cadmium resistance protein CadD (predicted permease)